MKQKQVFIVFSGIDGCGKTSILNMVRDDLEKNGVKTSVQWLRFNHVLCKPLHAAARVLGLARKQKMTEGGEWRHEFYRSPFFCKIYVWATYLDTISGKKKAMRKARKDQCDVVICDRWIPDIIIDLAVKCRDNNLLHNEWSKRFLKLLPDHTLLLCITRPRQALLDCRAENREDADFVFRLDQYEDWIQSGKTEVVRNDGTLEDAGNTARTITSHFIEGILK